MSSRRAETGSCSGYVIDGSSTARRDSARASRARAPAARVPRVRELASWRAEGARSWAWVRAPRERDDGLRVSVGSCAGRAGSAVRGWAVPGSAVRGSAVPGSAVRGWAAGPEAVLLPVLLLGGLVLLMVPGLSAPSVPSGREPAVALAGRPRRPEPPRRRRGDRRPSDACSCSDPVLTTHHSRRCLALIAPGFPRDHLVAPPRASRRAISGVPGRRRGPTCGAAAGPASDPAHSAPHVVTVRLVWPVGRHRRSTSTTRRTSGAERGIAGVERASGRWAEGVGSGVSGWRGAGWRDAWA